MADLLHNSLPVSSASLLFRRAYYELIGIIISRASLYAQNMRFTASTNSIFTYCEGEKYDGYSIDWILRGTPGPNDHIVGFDPYEQFALRPAHQYIEIMFSNLHAAFYSQSSCTHILIWQKNTIRIPPDAKNTPAVRENTSAVRENTSVIKFAKPDFPKTSPEVKFSNQPLTNDSHARVVATLLDAVEYENSPQKSTPPRISTTGAIDMAIKTMHVGHGKLRQKLEKINTATRSQHKSPLILSDESSIINITDDNLTNEFAPTKRQKRA